MKSSYFYHNLPYEEGKEPDWLLSMEEYSQVNSLRVYMLKNPVVDSEHEELSIHGEDNKIREAWSYGNDPRNIPG